MVVVFYNTDNKIKNFLERNLKKMFMLVLYIIVKKDLK